MALTTREGEASAGPPSATKADVSAAFCHVLRIGDDVQRCWAAKALGLIGDSGAVEALCACLDDADEDVRVDAAEALGLIGDRHAGSVLLRNLIEDPCSEVKVAAVEALARLGHREAIPILRSLARDRAEDGVVWDETEWLSGGWDDWLDVQIKAIEALGRLGADEAAPVIMDAVQDEMGQDLDLIGMRTLAGLGEVGATALAGFLGSDGRRRQRCMQALIGVDGAAGEAMLVQGLMDRDPRVRRSAALALAGRDAADLRLAPLLGDPDPEIRAQMVGRCATLPSDRLDRLLDDPVDSVQVTVLERLAGSSRLTARNLPRRLRVKLRGPSVEVAVAAVPAVVRHAPEIALADLSEQLGDRRCPSPVRAAAARGLGEMGAAAMAPLAEVLADDQREVRLAAMAAVARIAGADGPGADAARTILLAGLRGEIAAAPAEEAAEPKEGTPTPSSDAGAVPPSSTAEPAEGATNTALSMADRVEGPGEQAPSMAEPTEGAARPSASAGDTTGGSAEAASTSAAPSSAMLAANDRVLDDPESAVESEPEAEATDRDGTADATPTTGADEEVTEAAPPWPTSTLDAILGQGARAASAAAPSQVELTDDDRAYLELAKGRPRKRRVSPDQPVPAHDDVPRFAARLLGDFAGDDVADALAATLDTRDLELQRAAADSLVRLGQRMGHLPVAVTEIVAGATRADTDREVRLLATRALGAAARAEAGATLDALLDDDDPFVRAEAARALATLGRPDGIERLLADRDPMVRSAAAEALAQLGGADVVTRLVHLVFAFEGYHARAAGRLLRRLDPGTATSHLLAVLAEPGAAPRWCHAIEALEELHRPESAALTEAGAA